MQSYHLLTAKIFLFREKTKDSNKREFLFPSAQKIILKYLKVLLH